MLGEVSPGIQCQVWHFIYLATGAVAVSTPKSPDDSSVLLSSGHGQAKTPNRPGDDAWHHARGTRRKRKPERVGLGPGCLESATMAEQLDEAVKLLILLSHRAAALDDTRLYRRVDALVDSYLAGFGTSREQLAQAFSEKAPPSTASERIRE
jgi:hypothetical protein